MSESYIQLPPDSTGKRARTIRRTIGGVEVHDRVVAITEPGGLIIDPRDSSLFNKPTYVVTVLQSSAGASKYHVLIYNPTNSTTVYAVTQVIISPALTATVTGYPMGFRIYRVTSYSGGTAVTINKYDTQDPNPALQAVTAPTSVTVTNLLMGVGVNPEETGGSNIFIWQYNGIGKPIILRPGEGITIQQYATAGVGAFDFTVLLIAL